MFVPTPDRITRSAAIALGALALTSPAANASPAIDLVSSGKTVAVQHTAPVTAAVAVSDAAQSSTAVTRATRSDAAQIDAPVVAASRSDAAQRVPGEATPPAPQAVDSPSSPVVDDGFEWTGVAIGGLLALLAAAGIAAVRPGRRGPQQA